MQTSLNSATYRLLKQWNIIYIYNSRRDFSPYRKLILLIRPLLMRNRTSLISCYLRMKSYIRISIGIHNK